MKQFFVKIVLLLLVIVGTQQKTNAESDHKNLNPFKQKTVSPAKVASATWNSAAEKAAKGDESEWKKLVSCSYVDYATLVYDNLAAGDNTIVKSDINYMLSHTSLAIRHIKKGDKIWGIKADGTFDYYLALSDFDCDVLVYKTTDSAGNTIEIDIAIWDCFNPKVYVRTETKPDVVTVTRIDTQYIVQTVEKPVYYKEYVQADGYQVYSQGSYYPVQQPVYYPQGYFMFPIPQCVPLFGCQPTYTCWSGGVQCGMYPRTPQNNQTVNVSVNVTNVIIVNNTNTNNNTVVTETPRPTPVRPTPTGVITGGSGETATVNGGGGDYPVTTTGTVSGGDGTGGSGSGSVITGGSGKMEAPLTRLNASRNPTTTTANVGNASRPRTESQDNQFYSPKIDLVRTQSAPNSSVSNRTSANTTPSQQAQRPVVSRTMSNSTAPPQMYGEIKRQEQSRGYTNQPQSYGQNRVSDQSRSYVQPQQVGSAPRYIEQPVRSYEQQRAPQQQVNRGQQYSSYNQPRVQPQPQVSRMPQATRNYGSQPQRGAASYNTSRPASQNIGRGVR